MKEMEVATPQNSKHTILSMQKLHPNIEILAHPDVPIIFWSHHEKLVVIDQCTAFMGGLDLCWGRYEYPGYHIVDNFIDKETEIYPGQDYNNVRVADFSDLEQPDKCLIDKATVPRMPWRDIAVQIEGDAVLSLVRHFISYWNFSKVCLSGYEKSGMLTNNKNKSMWSFASGEDQKGKQRSAASLMGHVFSDIISRNKNEKEEVLQHLAPVGVFVTNLLTKKERIRGRWQNAIHRVLLDNFSKGKHPK